jgi:PAS domain-containing protein
VKHQIEEAKKELIRRGKMFSVRISFRCRMRERNQPRTEVITYQVVQIVGNLTYHFGGSNENVANSQHNSRKRTHEQRDAGGCGKVVSTLGNGMDSGQQPSLQLTQHLLFKGFVTIIPTSPMAELSLIDANLDEYVTRLSLDGTLLFADHRISMIAGYMPHEVVNRSAYGYIILDDHAISLFAHKLMLSSSNGTGIIVHRLKTATGGYIFIQSAGCLQYDRDTGQVDHFVCVSRLLKEDEGDKERDKFVKRFTPHITNSSPHVLYQSLQIVIGPRSTKGYSQATGKITSGEDSCSSSPSCRDFSQDTQQQLAILGYQDQLANQAAASAASSAKQVTFFGGFNSFSDTMQQNCTSVSSAPALCSPAMKTEEVASPNLNVSDIYIYCDCKDHSCGFNHIEISDTQSQMLPNVSF